MMDTKQISLLVSIVAVCGFLGCQIVKLMDVMITSDYFVEKVEPLPLITTTLMTPQKRVIMPVSKKQVVVELPYKQSIHDAYAQEESDDIQDNELAKEIHLSDTEMHPIVHPIAYNISAYLHNFLPISEEPLLINHIHESNGDDVYASESADNHSAPLPHRKNMSLSDKQFLRAPPHDYTIQLVGSYNTGFLHHYIQINKLNKISFQLKTGNSKHPWNIVTYGIFSTEKSARIALLQLPNTLRFNGAWIRQVGNVKRHLTIM
jgi:hypothetical protein